MVTMKSMRAGYMRARRKKMSRVKKCLSVLVGIALVSVLLVGLGLASEVPTQADGDFGADAYTYMEYLSTNYPERIAGSDVVNEARNWLISTVQGFGYKVLAEYCEGTSPLGWGDYTGYNLTFTKQGTGEKTIVVCAHYDCAWTTGADDNASGVGVLLETAKRVYAEELPYTVQFILFDIEEPGCVGSQYYVEHASQEYLDSLLCVINIDSVAAGDVMYAYGGDVDEQGSFLRTWALWQTIEIAQSLNIDVTIHPDVNSDYPSPTKNDGSDQTAFNAVGIPYVYFEASNWNGASYNNFYQTSNELVENGKIMHVAEYDNMTFLNATFPGRVQGHLTAYSRLVYEMLYKIYDPSEVQEESSAEETFVEETSSETEVVETETYTEAEALGEFTDTDAEIDAVPSEETSDMEETAPMEIEVIETESEEPEETLDEVSGDETKTDDEETENLETESDNETESSENMKENSVRHSGLWFVLVLIIFVVAIIGGILFVRRKR